MPQEFQIPSGGCTPDSQESVRRAVNDIYQGSEQDSACSERARQLYKEIHELSGHIAEARQHKLDTQFFVEPDRRKNFVHNATRLIFGGSLESLTENHLKTWESSRVGAAIFGDMLPYEVQREFFFEGNDADGFCHYFFHQAMERDGARQAVTLHYEVQPVGVLKISSDNRYNNEIIAGQELDNFVKATRVYHDKVISDIYGVKPGLSRNGAVNSVIKNYKDGSDSGKIAA